MKSKALFLSLALIVFSLFQIQAQDLKSELKEFKIIIENTYNGISMKSTDGSEWLDLSFSLNKNAAKVVDEYGMTELGKVSKEKDENLADFLFTITKTEKGIELEGIEGTAWQKLSFNLSTGSKQAIDQFGMTSLN